MKITAKYNRVIKRELALYGTIGSHYTTLQSLHHKFCLTRPYFNAGNSSYSTNWRPFLRAVKYKQIDCVGVSDDKEGLHWYQWFNTHKQTPLLLMVLRRVSFGTNGKIGTTRKWHHSSGSRGEYTSHKADLDYFLMGSGWVQGNSGGPLVLMVRFVPIENDVIPMVLVVNTRLMKGN